MRSLECKKCGRWVDNVGETTKTVTCSYCTMMLVGLPEEPRSAYKPTGRPAGWHFMNEFVDKDGNVFHKGKEQPNLKGTLPPTKVKPPKKKAKRRSKEQILIDRHNEKKAALKKAVKKQKDFLNHQFGK
jgi:hypothetical protein|tara:strand:+ start:638 stop:1024 length:387 start_codon:yes stop_codon:yes gene_type:complete